MKRGTKKAKKKIPKWIQPAAQWIATAVSVLCLAGVTDYSIAWSEASGSFNLTSTDVRGNSILGRDEVTALAKVPFAQSLNEISLEEIQRRIEAHPYVKGARVSRRYPKSITIDVVEREPIAYINLPSFLVMDEDCLVMPLRHGDMEFNVPTLTGFNNADELYPIGEKCLSHKTLEAIEYLTRIRQEFPELFDDISELTVDKSDEYVIVLAEQPTRIHFGQSDMLGQISLLKEFNTTLSGVKSLHSYHYVDLRYKNQIVVRERT
jgi:cell division protein FtsQ